MCCRSYSANHILIQHALVVTGISPGPHVVKDPFRDPQKISEHIHTTNEHERFGKTQHMLMVVKQESNAHNCAFLVELGIEVSQRVVPRVTNLSVDIVGR